MMKNFFQNKDFQLDEIIFEGRNRDYGAYSLRHDSDKILTRSMFYGIGLFVTVSAVPFILNSLKTEKPVIEIPTSGPFMIKNIPPDEIKNPVKVTPVAPPKTTSFDSTVPTPSHKATVEKPAATISDYEKGTAGTQKIEGELPGTTYTPPVDQTGTVVAPVAPIIKADPPKDDKKIETVVDVEAAFAGGMDSFRNKVQSNFNVAPFDGSGETIKTVVTFVVEKDGSISNIKATGPDATFNREAENTIRSIRGKWSPAKLGGESVRSYFKFPITMAFE